MATSRQNGNLSRAQAHIVIIGGGIAGLSAAWQLHQMQRYLPITCTVLEASKRWGGKIVTERFYVTDDQTGQRVGPFVVDAGPESFITRKPAAWQLARELGMDDQIIDPGSETRNIYVLDAGRPVLLPMSPLAFARSTLLSTRGKLRMLREPFEPARRDNADESLADFVSRRLGREALDKFLGPVLGGIYNTDPEQQSILTTSPVMREMEREGGSLVAGSFARMKAKAKARKEAEARGERFPPSFMTFRSGTEPLVAELVHQLDQGECCDLRLDSEVVAVKAEEGGYRVYLPEGETLLADGVIFATPANVTGKLLSPVAPASAAELAQIRHVHIGTISIAYREADLRLSKPVSGLMIPRRERRLIDAMTFTSAKFTDRAPTGYALMRVFFGGGAPYTIALDNDQLTALVTLELKNLLGIRARPLGCAIHRWPSSYPQADVGHLDRVARIEESLPLGLAVTGGSYRGIGVPDCIEQGRESAIALVTALENRPNRVKTKLMER